MTSEREKEIRTLLVGHATPIAHIAYELLVENRQIQEKLQVAEEALAGWIEHFVIKPALARIRGEKVTTEREKLAIDAFSCPNCGQDLRHPHASELKEEMDRLREKLTVAVEALEKFANAKRRTIVEILLDSPDSPKGVLMLEIDNEIADEALAKIRGEK